VHELNFITDLVEEKLVRGNLLWLANFTEVHRDYAIGDITVPVYALGSLEERGFLLSRIFSAFVTPKYKIHFVLWTSNEFDTKSLRKIIVACKNKFGPDDWILIELVQNKPIDRPFEGAVKGIADSRVGVAASSLASKEEVTSENVLGKGLRKQLKLTEPKFEVFDMVDYLKSFVIVFSLGTLLLILLQLFFTIQAVNPITLLLMLIFSVILGFSIYKTRYHTVLSLNAKGFEVRKGKSVTQGKWAEFSDVAVYIAPSHETFLRLHSREKTVDLPLSRVGISRKDTYNTIRQFVKTK